MSSGNTNLSYGALRLLATVWFNNGMWQMIRRTDTVDTLEQARFVRVTPTTGSKLSVKLTPQAAAILDKDGGAGLLKAVVLRYATFLSDDVPVDCIGDPLIIECAKQLNLITLSPAAN
ncbi:hypothetical protein KJ596_03230 [Patescibacteria group bacterium]|nr:hypothetical protein [Patescibacteria group bacterium]MBU1867901.1 hypothetical protein [Patescibacteria group bacterium]